MDTPVFQRLRAIKQLNFVYLAYDGATHSRFEHAIGVNHTGKEAVARLRGRDPRMASVSELDEVVFLTACLLHDLSHSGIGSHLLEELEMDGVDHEEAVEQMITSGAIREVLESHGLGPVEQDRIARLIRKAHWDHPLQSLLSSSFDIDKLDYMQRDSERCGVPYGLVDRDRILDSLVLVDDPCTGLLTVGLEESGLLSLEHLLHGRRLLYSAVYYNKAVRSASAMRQRLVVEALHAGLLSRKDLAEWTDEDVQIRLGERINGQGNELCATLHQGLTTRSLYREVAAWRGPALRNLKPSSLWALADQVCYDLAYEPGAILIDLPHKPGLMRAEGLCQLRDGSVTEFQALGARFPLAQMQGALEEAVFTLRVFVQPKLRSDAEVIRRAVGEYLGLAI